MQSQIIGKTHQPPGQIGKSNLRTAHVPSSRYQRVFEMHRPKARSPVVRRIGASWVCTQLTGLSFCSDSFAPSLGTFSPAAFASGSPARAAACSMIALTSPPMRIVTPVK